MPFAALDIKDLDHQHEILTLIIRLRQYFSDFYTEKLILLLFILYFLEASH